MLVLCVGMYRACSTWQYGVVGELLERHREGVRLGFADGDDFVKGVEPTVDPRRWSVLKAHEAHGRFAERLDRGEALGIYSHRDLRDVLYSWARKVGREPDELIAHGFLEHCLVTDRFWRDRAGMLFQAYEALTANPVRGVEEIAAHLGIAIDRAEAESIADLLSFESNRQRTRAISDRLQAEGVPLASTDLDHYDRKTLLHWNHIRDGRSGYWAELASPEQRDILTRVCGPWLVEHGYEVEGVDPVAIRPAPLDLAPPLISHARNREDVLVDRMFRGQKASYLHVGAEDPVTPNSTFSFYRRGWRGVTIGLSPAETAANQARRLADLNLGLDSQGPLTLGGLIAEHGLFPPDLFVVDLAADPSDILAGLPLDHWRPKLFVVGESPKGSRSDRGSWEPSLLDRGYLAAGFDGINRFYLRGDLAGELRHFEVPVNALDPYVTAETVGDRERADALRAERDDERRRTEAVAAEGWEAKVELAHLKVGYGDELEARHRDYLAWLDEREAMRVEREAAAAERRAWEAQRQAWEVDRQAWEAERRTARAERDTIQGELRALREGLDVAIREVADLEVRRDSLAGEVQASNAEIARLHAEIHDRDVELERTRTRLRPYLKIDRMGVVTAIQRRVHAHRSHEKS